MINWFIVYCERPRKKPHCGTKMNKRDCTEKKTKCLGMYAKHLARQNTNTTLIPIMTPSCDRIMVARSTMYRN